MNNKYTITVFVTCILVSFVSMGQYNRNLFLLHGLGGDNNSFVKLAEAINIGATGFSPRKINVYTELNYDASQEYGLTAAAIKIQEQIASKPFAYTYKRNNFIIAHSQGGIVSRKLNQIIGTNENIRTFGGIVTIGSPNGGAMILNNRDTKLIPLANEACNKLLPSLIYNKLTKQENTKAMFRPIVTRISETFANAVCNGLLPADASKFSVIDVVAGHFKSTITESYKVGATELNQINTFHQSNSTAINKALFYGTKDNSDLFWRVFHYFKLSPNSEAAFGANYDYPGVVEGQNILMDYQSSLAAERLAYSNCGTICKIFNGQAYRDRIAALDNAVWFLQNINTKWLDAIGAATITTTTNTTCYCVDPNGGSFSFPTTGTCPSSTTSTNTCTTSSAVTTSVLTNKPSDGVVLVESQTAFPGVPTQYKFQLQNNSHMQERNSPQLKDAMNVLFNGGLGSYFTTPIK